MNYDGRMSTAAIEGSVGCFTHIAVGSCCGFWRMVVGGLVFQLSGNAVEVQQCNSGGLIAESGSLSSLTIPTKIYSFDEVKIEELNITFS